MKPIGLLGSLCVVIATVACGGGTAADPSPGAGAGSAAASAAPASSAAVVPYEKLAALFPAIPGFTREYDPRGETDTTEHVSRAQADYAQDGGGMGRLSVEMMDVSTNSMMLAPFRELQRHPGVQKTGTGTQKTTTVGGFPAYEEWTPEAGNGVVGILVADRFLVTVTGSSVGNVDVIYKALEAIDLKKTAALK